MLTVLYDEASTVITWRIRFESETDAERLRSQLAQGRYVRDDTDRDLRRRVIREQREVIVAAGSPRDLLPTDLAQLAWTRAPGSMPELGMQDESPIALGIECELPPD